jgi:hypothetical protein
MTKIFYLHWNQAELEERIRPLLSAGFEVVAHSTAGSAANVTEPYPAAFVISLDRLPSHGRAVAEWVWEAKKRQSIPIIFEGGQIEKQEQMKQKFPRAIFCRTGQALEALKNAGIKAA